MEFVPENNSETDSDDETTEIPTPVVLEDKYMELSERFDQHKLNHILQNQDEFKKQMRPSCFENDYNPFTILNKYLMKSQNGTLKTKYKQNNGRGRFHAIKSLSLQSMPREIRHTLAREFYIDIDIVNAHPNILLHLCKQKNMYPKILKKYCKSRDKMLEKFKVELDVAKTVILSMINGGKNAYDSLAYKPAFLKEFKKEMNTLHKMFSTEDAFDAHVEKREGNGITNNHKASYMNTLLCDFENKILQTMYEYFKKPTDAVLCFDGIMLPRGEYDLKGCEKYIYEMIGIKIDLKEKPMTEGFEIDEVPSYEEPKTSLYTDFESFVNKEIYVNTLDEWCQNSIVLINNGGNHFFLTKNQRVDSMTNEVSIYYKQVSEKTIMSNLKAKCLVLNDSYDYEFSQNYYNLPVKHRPRLTENDRLKLDPYLYTIIGPKIGESAGYLNEAIFSRTLPSKNNVEFYPYLRKLGEPKLHDCFNIFTGFPLEDVPLTMTDKFEQSLFYKHIGDELMNGDLGEMDHFMDHIADIIQMPHLVRGPSHLFYSAPGLGKGLLAVFMARLLGKDHVITFSDVSTYFSNFNSEQANKLLKIFEEVSEKGDAFHKHDRLKGDTTKTHDRIEPKGIDAYSIRHCSRYWFYSNNANALYVENNDRRYTMHRANNRMANNTEYFNKLWPLIKNESFCRMAFEYFSERKYTEKSVLTAYDTKYKNEQKINNIPNGIKFIIDLIESDFENVVRDEDKISARVLAQAFKDWSAENGCKYNANAFKSQIAKIGLDSPTTLRMFGKNTKCYTINVDNMRVVFREFLKMPTFDFNIIVADEE